jgi:hypothetical protein
VIASKSTCQEGTITSVRALPGTLVARPQSTRENFRGRVAWQSRSKDSGVFFYFDSSILRGEMSSSGVRDPKPAYSAISPFSPLHTDHRLYGSIASAPRSLIYSHIVPIRSGHAWTVRAGQVCRLTTPEGPQVGDLNIWSLQNPRERFWAARTRQLHRSHVSTFDRLWSCLPYLRPMVTIIGDSLSGYGVDEVGGRCHDLLGTRCDPYGKSSCREREASEP